MLCSRVAYAEGLVSTKPTSGNQTMRILAQYLNTCLSSQRIFGLHWVQTIRFQLVSAEPKLVRTRAQLVSINPS